VISDDAEGGNVENPTTRFEPREDGIDFHESLEGMLVRVRQPMAVGPTNSFGELPVGAEGGLLGFPRTPRGGVLIRPSDFNPERIILDDVLAGTPDANVGDRLGDVTAVVDYSFGNFKYLVTADARVAHDARLEPETTEAPRSDELAIASMNVENLAGDEDQAKYCRLANIVVDNLKAPDIVAAEEIQDNDGAPAEGNSDASTTWRRFIETIDTGAGCTQDPVNGPTYEYRQIDPVPGGDGGEPGGNIRVGFLFRTDRGVSFANVAVLGDLNDFEFSETLDILEGRGRLTNLMETLPVFERYSYVFDGNSQVLDQVLVSRNVAATRPEYDSVHVNAEFFEQASDHDPQVARLKR
jgi:predicted extracellular nuclease